MSTNDLIEHLAGDLQPVARSAPFRRVATGVLVGVAISAGMMLALLGGRPDFLRAILNGAELAEGRATCSSLPRAAFWQRIAFRALTAKLSSRLYWQDCRSP